MFEKRIKKFIDDLAATPLTPHVKNPWAGAQVGGEIRRKNLAGYFAKMQTLKPAVLLVGEAPGYRGCGRVGMPFSSEKLVLSHPFFADRAVFEIENVTDPIAEASASIVWKTFDSLDFYPLMWAAYPYHPHQPGDQLSNRAPKPNEVLVGRPFIEELINLYNIKQVVAVGKIAERTLADMGIAAPGIRHPSHGGAVMFAQGLSALKARL